MAIVHRYIRMKKAPSHQVEESMMKRPTVERVERWPPRKMRVNMESQTQVQVEIAARTTKP